MGKLQDTLTALDSKGLGPNPALMTHVVLGYPSLDESIELVKAMADNGAKFIELQIPFSDPMADGPTIMSANEAALAQGVTPGDCMKAMETLASSVDVPLIFMTYFNLVYAYNGGAYNGGAYQGGQDGVRNFSKDAANAGAEALIVPDIPPEENSEGYWSITKEYGLLPVPLVSPISSDERLKRIAAVSDPGFVYCVSTTGTTGARKGLPEELPEYLTRVRKYFDMPLAVGFGISSRGQVENLSEHAEIAIVGSAMIDCISKSDSGQRVKAVAAFTKELAGVS